MKINRQDNNTIEFGYLGNGDVFVDTDNTICMKIDQICDECENNLNAVSLESGVLSFFYPDEKVKKVRAELIVE